MGIERKVNMYEGEKPLITRKTKKALGLLAGGTLAVSAIIVCFGPKKVGHYIYQEFHPVSICEKEKTPQEVQDCKDRQPDYPPSGQHMW